MPLKPFIVYDPNTNEAMVVPVLRLNVIMKPRYISLTYMFTNVNSTSNLEDYDIAIFFQASCNPPILYGSNLVNVIGKEDILKVNIIESVKIVDKRVKEDSEG